MSVTVRSPDSLGQNFRHPKVPTPTRIALQEIKQTLSERYLTTLLPSGKVKYWGCLFDVRRSPLRRSSTNHNNNKHAEHKNLSRGSATPQRSSYVLVVEVTTKIRVSSTSLPLSKQPQRLLELSTKKSRVIQTSQGSSTRWKLLGDA